MEILFQSPDIESKKKGIAEQMKKAVPVTDEIFTTTLQVFKDDGSVCSGAPYPSHFWGVRLSDPYYTKSTEFYRGYVGSVALYVALYQRGLFHSYVNLVQPIFRNFIFPYSVPAIPSCEAKNKSSREYCAKREVEETFDT